MGEGHHSLPGDSEVDDRKSGASFLAFIFVFTVLLISVLTLLAWQFDISFIRNPFYVFSTMNPVTAVCFFLASFSYLLYLRGPQSKNWNFLIKLVAAIIMLVGFLRVSQAVGMLSFKI